VVMQFTLLLMLVLWVDPLLTAAFAFLQAMLLLYIRS
jgi:hypothetical protein